MLRRTILLSQAPSHLYCSQSGVPFTTVYTAAHTGNAINSKSVNTLSPGPSLRKLSAAVSVSTCGASFGHNDRANALTPPAGPQSGLNRPVGPLAARRRHFPDQRSSTGDAGSESREKPQPRDLRATLHQRERAPAPGSIYCPFHRQLPPLGAGVGGPEQDPGVTAPELLNTSEEQISFLLSLPREPCSLQRGIGDGLIGRGAAGSTLAHSCQT